MINPKYNNYKMQSRNLFFILEKESYEQSFLVEQWQKYIGPPDNDLPE